MQKRLLIVNRHYWPDNISYAKMLQQKAVYLAGLGYEVHVATTQKSYRPVENEQKMPPYMLHDGVHIHFMPVFPLSMQKLAGRLINTVPFLIGTMLHVLRKRLTGARYHLAIVATDPPIAEAFVIRYLMWLAGGKYIYLLQDIHPEVEAQAGVIRRGGLLYRFLQWVDSTTMNRAAASVVLSADMHKTLERRPHYAPNHIAIINNFYSGSATDSTPSLPAGLRKKEGVFRVMFAGNIGFFQGLEHVMEAAEHLQNHADMEWVFLGEGRAKAKLIEAARDKGLLDRTVFFHPFVPSAVAEEAIAESDVAIISLKPDILHFAYPSKTATYACSGTYIAALIHAESELAHTLHTEGLGDVCASGDGAGLAQLIERAYQKREQLAADKAARIARARAVFGAEQVLPKWRLVIERCLSGA